MTTLETYLRDPSSKYAVIGLQAWQADTAAQSISSQPRTFSKSGNDFVILSLNPSEVPALVAYSESAGHSLEFEFAVGTGRISLLTHSQALALTSELNEP